MGVAQVKAQSGEGLVALEVDKRVHTVGCMLGVGQPPGSHVDDDGLAVEGDLLDARTGRDAEAALTGEALAAQIRGEDAHAVATHLGDAAVGIAVVHEPFGPIGLGAHVGVGREPGRRHWDDTVAADARAPVGELGG